MPSIAKTLLALVLGAVPAAAAVQMADSPAARQAEALLEQGAGRVMDGNARRPSLRVDGPAWADDDPETPARPPVRVGGDTPQLREPANPIPPETTEDKPSGGFLGGLSLKTIGFAAGGALLGVGLGLLLGWGWLPILGLALAGAAIGWFAPKLF